MIIEGINRVRGFEAVKNAPEDTKLPVRSSKGSAGYDFFAPIDIYVPAWNASDLIPLNVKAYMQDGEHLQIVIRSSLATKRANLVVAQGTAIIDADYYGNPDNDGNIGIKLYNRGDKDYVIKKGERCCQGIFVPFLKADNDDADGERTGGYGSTGK